MTEPQYSPNEGDSSLPQPATEANLHALANQIAVALNTLTDASQQIAQALNTANQKPKIDLITKVSLSISILSLVCTLVLGTFGTIYLYGKQAQTNINYSLAHLGLDVLPATTCHSKIKLGCLAELQVTNKGPAQATGITVDVFLTKIARPWSATIKDMKNFTINTLPSIVKVQKNLFYDTDPSALDTVAKFNAYELTINSLPPPPNNPTVQVGLGLSPAIPVVTKTTNINTTLYVVSQSVQNFNFGNAFPTNQVIQKYFNQFFSIAEFEVNVTCQNCTNDPSPLVSNSSSLDKATFALSLNPQNLLNSIWAGSITVTYERPKRSSLPAIGNSLYLWTQPDNPTAPLDSSTQTYMGIVTTCVPAGQPGGSQDACTPTSASGGG